MDEEVKEMLEEEIKVGICGLSALEPGSKERTDAIKELVELYKLRVGEKETENREREERFRIKDRYFKVAMEAATIVLPLLFYASWMKRGFMFEETGTFTSTTFRGLFNRFRPTNKH
jgi:hypothetical protein